jgi:hypothetical protein
MLDPRRRLSAGCLRLAKGCDWLAIRLTRVAFQLTPAQRFHITTRRSKK